MKFDETNIKNAERILRFAMIVTLFTAGVSKLFSHGGFFDWYSVQFVKPELRIHLPVFMVNLFLHAMPFIEIGIAVGLIYTPFKKYFVYAWCLFFISLEFGHYILQEWTEVNQMIPYIILGAICLILPNHHSWLKKDQA